ncbi:hypothetical protein SUAG_00061 [Sulfitobacter phage pCB2047-A]|uniref:hypothetical protein n=1 Tax=Sulfitobacter phage pCB2047-A TaxID=754045 RepID=UPI0002C0986A|nr:hypothetical protein SUAG_00061 [Sulfitobacter phage pCB2047-A]AGH30787.1 hypothetical protein SUAG_00061 [Sulfitobacter phage pCB2047-A]
MASICKPENGYPYGWVTVLGTVDAAQGGNRLGIPKNDAAGRSGLCIQRGLVMGRD